MPRLEETQIKNDAVADWDKIPEARKSSTPPLPPGTYEFQLPEDLKDCWSDKFSTDLGERVALKVTLTVASARDTNLVGEKRTYRINGAERNRARRGEPEKYVSELQYLYRDGLQGKDNPKGIMDLARAIEKKGGSKFVADVEWSTFCSGKKVRWVRADDGKIVEDPEGKMGCGANYYQSQIPKNEDGTLADRFQCGGCGASLRVFDGVTAFRAPLAG